MSFDTHFATQLLVGNLGYLLLVVSMLMTRMLLLRLFAIASGAVGVIYTHFWVHDVVGTFWEAAFALVNVGQIALTSYRNSLTRFTPDERALYELIVPSLEPNQVRKLLRTGRWTDANAGHELTCQGEPIQHLCFLRFGEASVVVDGLTIGNSGPGSLIGEMSMSTGDPATASVIANRPVRYFGFERASLQKLMHDEPEIERAIEAGYRQSLRKKLVQMNLAALGRS